MACVDRRCKRLLCCGIATAAIALEIDTILKQFLVVNWYGRGTGRLKKHVDGRYRHYVYVCINMEGEIKLLVMGGGGVGGLWS